jgi:hypothetical protein
MGLAHTMRPMVEGLDVLELVACGLVLSGISLYVLYWVIRAAVRAGIQDAERWRREKPYGAETWLSTAPTPTSWPPSGAG